MTDELRSPAPLSEGFNSWWDSLPDNIPATTMGKVRMAWEAGVASARSDKDATLREERDTAVAHANGLTDLIRRMDAGYVLGLEDAAQFVEDRLGPYKAGTKEFLAQGIRALKNNAVAVRQAGEGQRFPVPQDDDALNDVRGTHGQDS